MTNHELAELKKQFTEFLILDLEGVTKEEVTMNIARFAKNEGLVDDSSMLSEKFLEHERMHSIMAGSGIMLPEAYGIEMTRSYAFILCRTKERMDLYTPDREDVRIALASLVRDKNSLSRLKPMIRLVKALKSRKFREEFLRVKNTYDAYQALKRTRERTSYESI